MQDVHLRLQMALTSARMSTWDASVVGDSVLEGTIAWSAEGAALIGLTPIAQSQAFSDFLRMVHPDDAGWLLEAMQRRVDECAGYAFEYRLLRPDGQMIWLACRATTICEDGAAVRTLGLCWDDSGRKQQEAALAEQKELADVTLASIGDAVVTTDAQGRITFMNRVAEQLTGWSDAEARGLDVGQVVGLADEANGQPIDSPALRSLQLRQAIAVTSRAQLVTRDGHHVAVEDSAAPIWSRDGEVLGAVMVFHDVSHERRLTHQLSWQASHDALTGLLNRRAFEDAVAGALRSAKDERHHHALLYMDLDRFKIVNDSVGHGAGDVLLQTLARMLLGHMRESDVLARLGGDELGVLLPYCPMSRAEQLADELRRSIKDFRFVWSDKVFELGVSIGLVEISEESKSTSELLVAADQACYLAKEQGRNRIHVYRESDVMLARRQGELQWVTRLNDALAHDRFRLFAQHIVSLDGADDGHYEVLLRIASNENGDEAGNESGNESGNGSGLILPGAFIPAAERYDLMAPLDRWVVTHTCRHIARERARMGMPDTATGSVQRMPPPVYSVNLSGMSLGDEGMLAHIVAQFDENGVDPTQLCFEITETAVIANMPRAQEFIAALRALGCCFSLDDFGSGLSSFAYLRTLPVDYLKIDGVFIRGIAHNDINRALVKAINEVGHVMGIRTIAEYVEDPPTLDAVRALGIDYAQGYAVGDIRQLELAH
ncbi:EAL domain-containing protein [Massilia sp. 9096]|uniref:EAL domain-containing protein n=1 Tax=Massilia sp. 9096 TaxID=1500894 RepID=UPI00055DCF78|nr:EAL domain-containing protein [Massilia sp. 9096]